MDPLWAPREVHPADTPSINRRSSGLFRNQGRFGGIPAHHVSESEANAAQCGGYEEQAEELLVPKYKFFFVVSHLCECCKRRGITQDIAVRLLRRAFLAIKRR